MKSIGQQCIGIIKSLELNSNIYDLKIDDIPIWWFVRIRFYEKLHDFIESKEKKEAYFKYTPPSFFKIITQNCRQIIIFFLRAIIGGFLIMTNQIKRGPIMFFTYPQSRREWEGGKKIDPFIDRIFKRLINQSIIVEQITLGKPTIHNPFIKEKRVVFLDWAILTAFLKNIFNLFQKPEINGWDEFEKNNQKINFQVVSSDWVVNTVKEIIFSNRNKILLQVDTAQIIIKKFKPKIIVETVSYNSGTMALNYIAKKFSVPIIELQHGVFPAFYAGYSYFLPKDEINRVLPDKVLVYGNFFKEILLRIGNAFSSENIKVVGSSRLNNFLKENQFKKNLIREEVRKKIGIDNNVFLITITSDYLRSNFFAEFFKEILPLLEKKITICIKLHPMDNEEEERKKYKEIINPFRVKILTDDTIDLYQLLISSDLHATISSTVLFECLALGVPNIIIDVDRKFTSHFPEIANEKKIITVDNPDDFVNKIKELITNKNLINNYINTGRKLANYFFNTKENTEENIIKEINKFL